MNKSVSFLISFAFIIFIFSCTKEGGVPDPEIEYCTDNEHIKSISMNGTIVQKFLYDVSGRIAEENQ
jgi:hypothetical protein